MHKCFPLMRLVVARKNLFKPMKDVVLLLGQISTLVKIVIVLNNGQ